MAYSLRQASRIVGLTPATVSALVRAGVIAAPSDRVAHHDDLVFTFVDLATLRSLAGLPRSALKRSLRRGRSALLYASHGRRLRALGSRLVVAEPDGRLWDAETGQWLLSFDDQSATVAQVLVYASQDGREPASPILDPFERALRMESSDPDVAVALYRSVIEDEPDREEAYLNLGVLLQDAGRQREAVAVYRAGLEPLPASAMLHFNLGVALQALGAGAQARDSYLTALRIDPQFADAHQNLALCFIEAGDHQRAIRHANQARRLREPSGSQP